MDGRLSTKEKIEAIKRRRRAVELANYRMWRFNYCQEAFTPSFPPRLSYHEYPARSGTGALVTHQESLGDGPLGFLVVSYAADGQRWITAWSRKPVQKFDSPDDRL